jgi:hypothetical protein
MNRTLENVVMRKIYEDFPYDTEQTFLNIKESLKELSKKYKVVRKR